MGSRLYVKGGTPVGNVALCRTCTSAHIMTGYRESEQVILCSGVHPNIVVPFTISECTGYYDKNRPDWQQMKALAIDIVPKTLKPCGFKGVEETEQKGFLVVRRERKDGDDDDDD